VEVVVQPQVHQVVLAVLVEVVLVVLVLEMPALEVRIPDQAVEVVLTLVLMPVLVGRVW